MEKIDRPSPAFTRYPWPQIAAEGGWFKLIAGEDYPPGKDVSVCNAAYSWADRHGLKAHIRHPGPGVVEVTMTRENDGND